MGLPCAWLSDAGRNGGGWREELQERPSKEVRSLSTAILTGLHSHSPSASNRVTDEFDHPPPPLPPPLHPSPFPLRPRIPTQFATMDPNNPRETWNRIQSALSRAQHSAGGGGRVPKGAFGSGAALALLAGALFVGNSALFNGTAFPERLRPDGYIGVLIDRL